MFDWYSKYFKMYIISSLRMKIISIKCVMTSHLLTSVTCGQSAQLVRDIQCICRMLCHQIIPQGLVAVANLKAVASNRADGLWHDVWSLLSSHRPAWVVFGQVTSTSCASLYVPGGPIYCLSLNMIHGTTRQTLSDGPHCPREGDEVLLVFPRPCTRGIGNCSIYICCMTDTCCTECMQSGVYRKKG